MDEKIWLGKSETNPTHIVEPRIQNFIVARDTKSATKLAASWERQETLEHLTLAPASPPIHENTTDDKSCSSSDSSSSSSSSTQAPS